MVRNKKIYSILFVIKGVMIFAMGKRIRKIGRRKKRVGSHLYISMHTELCLLFVKIQVQVATSCCSVYNHAYAQWVKLHHYT